MLCVGRCAVFVAGGYWLLVVGCLLLVVLSALFALCCSLFVCTVLCWRMLFDVRCQLFVVCGVVCVVCWFLCRCGVGCSLFIVCCMLCVVCLSLVVVLVCCVVCLFGCFCDGYCVVVVT